MRVVLMSGGSGKRLWPMSNDSRSKQFLKVLHDAEGHRISMLQRVWSQIRAAGLVHCTYVCAPKSQYGMVENQIGPVPFIEEPFRRDTFPAVTLAALHLADVEGCKDDEVMVVLPVDPYVDGRFFEQIKNIDQVLHRSGANLLLIGVHPTEPSSKFGYIRVEARDSEAAWLPVRSFIEKPTSADAARYIAQGALWNCGVFCFSIGFLKSQLAKMSYPTTHGDWRAHYSQLPKRSFDYEVVENATDIAVVPYPHAWQDIGTWGALTEKIEDKFVGIGRNVECENTHVINELGIPLIAMGLRDTVIVATPDGILAANKHSSSEIKTVIAEYTQRPMFGERRWGSYRVMDYQKIADGTEVLTRSIELQAGKNISYHKHERRSEVWIIVEGSGELAMDSKFLEVSSGDVIRIYPGQWHAIRAGDNLTFIEIQRGSELVDEDVIRRYLTWDEVVEHCTVVAG